MSGAKDPRHWCGNTRQVTQLPRGTYIVNCPEPPTRRGGWGSGLGPACPGHQSPRPPRGVHRFRSVAGSRGDRPHPRRIQQPIPRRHRSRPASFPCLSHDSMLCRKRSRSRRRISLGRFGLAVAIMGSLLQVTGLSTPTPIPLLRRPSQSIPVGIWRFSTLSRGPDCWWRGCFEAGQEGLPHRARPVLRSKHRPNRIGRFWRVIPPWV